MIQNLYNRSKFFIVVPMILAVCLCACTAPAQKPEQFKPSKEINVDQKLAEQVKTIAKTVDGVEDSTAVVINNEISSAVKVNGFDRLFLKRIRQQVHSAIKKPNGDYVVQVTSDKKLFWQLQQIEKQIKSGENINLPKIEQKVNKINKDMRG
ncbi:MAG: sporulation protein [Firmicutes bacterium]|nr:sporulation protein [Bacillota bacterium]